MRNLVAGHLYSEQQGAVLLVSLLVLLIMTVIGVAAMRTNLLEEKMAGNFRDVDLAFQAGEAALRDAEADIDSGSRVKGLTGFNANCGGGLCDATSGFSEVWKESRTLNNGVVLGTYTGTGALAFLACQPKYWIEGFRTRPPGSVSWKTWYRITTTSCGASDKTRVVLQSVYAARS